MTHLCVASSAPFVNSVLRVDTVANLRLVQVPVSRQAYLTEGLGEAGDGGGRIYYWDDASVLTDNGTTIIQITGETTGRFLNWNPVYDNNVTPAQFGADPTGVEDSTDAINQAFQAVRDSIANGSAGASVRFSPTGKYLALGEIDATAIGDNPDPAYQWGIDGCGSTILTKASGGIGLDMLGSRFFYIDNLHIQSVSSNKPKHGLQIGRTDDGSTSFADGIMLKSVFIEGYFSLSGFYNFSAETLTAIDVKSWNYNTTGTSYAVINDGCNHFDCSSSFVTQTCPVDTATSFTQNTWIGMDHRCTAGANSIPLWMGHTSAHKYINGYVAGGGTHAIEIFSLNDGGNIDLSLDIHCESDVDHAITFTCDPAVTNQVMAGSFYFRDQLPFVTSSVFFTDPANPNVRLDRPEIDINAWGLGSPTNGVFYPRDHFGGISYPVSRNISNNAAIQGLRSQDVFFALQTDGAVTALDGGSAYWVMDVTNTTSVDDGVNILVDAAGNRWFNATAAESIIFAASDETTSLTTGAAKMTFRMPYAFTLTGVRASLTTAQASGNIFTVDLNENGTSVLSTKLTIDNTEKTSTTAATPAVISDAALANDAEITVDIDQIGNGSATGLKVTLIGRR